MSRTVLRFRPESEVGPTVDEWAQAEGYQRVDGSSGVRLYRKGAGFWVAPTFVSVREEGNEVELQAWVKASFLARLGAFFLIPAEMGLEPGGFGMAVPRRTGRRSLNALLERLGQQPIE